MEDLISDICHIFKITRTFLNPSSVKYVLKLHVNTAGTNTLKVYLALILAVI